MFLSCIMLYWKIGVNTFYQVDFPARKCATDADLRSARTFVLVRRFAYDWYPHSISYVAWVSDRWVPVCSADGHKEHVLLSLSQVKCCKWHGSWSKGDEMLLLTYIYRMTLDYKQENPRRKWYNSRNMWTAPFWSTFWWVSKRVRCSRSQLIPTCWLTLTSLPFEIHAYSALYHPWHVLLACTSQNARKYVSSLTPHYQKQCNRPIQIYCQGICRAWECN